MTESQKNVLSFINNPCLKNREKAFKGYVKLAKKRIKDFIVTNKSPKLILK